MIPQAPESYIKSRSECNVYKEDNYLPLFTAPMNGVCDHTNYKQYLNHKIIPVLSRSSDLNKIDMFDKNKIFVSSSLSNVDKIKHFPKICIDTANGNMNELHVKIKSLKKENPDLIIMSGNVSTTKAFIFLEQSGCDYIRVGIGGGGGCTTTVHTGVGQSNLLSLIQDISQYRPKAKIIADGISSLIKKENYHKNGYAAINNLLYYGADYVMIGSIFAKSTEGSNLNNGAETVFGGMSTSQNQQTYSSNIKHSEGSWSKIKIEYSLDEWLNGCKEYDLDKYPGFIPCLQSAMSYTNSKTLNEFKWI